jgi:hypothetical protein
MECQGNRRLSGRMPTLQGSLCVWQYPLDVSAILDSAEWPVFP